MEDTHRATECAIHFKRTQGAGSTEGQFQQHRRFDPLSLTLASEYYHVDPKHDMYVRNLPAYIKAYSTKSATKLVQFCGCRLPVAKVKLARPSVLFALSQSAPAAVKEVVSTTCQPLGKKSGTYIVAPKDYSNVSDLSKYMDEPSTYPPKNTVTPESRRALHTLTDLLDALSHVNYYTTGNVEEAQDNAGEGMDTTDTTESEPKRRRTCK